MKKTIIEGCGESIDSPEMQRIENYRKTTGCNLSLGIEHHIGCYLYDFIVKNNIKLIVETGICHGFSSWYFLEGLKRTGGRLHSIDPKPQDIIVVPSELSKSWTIYKEASPEFLIKLLGRFTKENKIPDMFWHDGNHQFQYQLGEYCIAADAGIRYVSSHDTGRMGSWRVFLRLYKDDFGGVSAYEQIHRQYKFSIAESRDAIERTDNV